jgi:phage repressor protein C with HTH and peptisase S24 domain
VSNWESVAGVHPTMVNLAAIAQACNVSLDWLGTGRGVMSGDTLDDVQTADAELVDAPAERRLLSIYRSLPRHSQTLILDLLELLVVRKRLAKNK